MIGLAFVRQFAAGQQIDLEIADQEIVLHYALALLNEVGLVGFPREDAAPGPGIGCGRWMVFQPYGW